MEEGGQEEEERGGGREGGRGGEEGAVEFGEVDVGEVVAEGVGDVVV